MLNGNECSLPYVEKVVPGETISIQAIPDENWGRRLF